MVAHRSTASTPFFPEHQHLSLADCTNNKHQDSQVLPAHPSPLHLSLDFQLSPWDPCPYSLSSPPLVDLPLDLDSTLDLDLLPTAQQLLSLTQVFQSTTLVAHLQCLDLGWVDSPACLRCHSQDSTDLPTTT